MFYGIDGSARSCRNHWATERLRLHECVGRAFLARCMEYHGRDRQKRTHIFASTEQANAIVAACREQRFNLWSHGSISSDEHDRAGDARENLCCSIEKNEWLFLICKSEHAEDDTLRFDIESAAKRGDFGSCWSDARSWIEAVDDDCESRWINSYPRGVIKRANARVRDELHARICCEPAIPRQEIGIVNRRKV